MKPVLGNYHKLKNMDPWMDHCGACSDGGSTPHNSTVFMLHAYLGLRLYNRMPMNH